jgi:hypothetical protein
VVQKKAISPIQRLSTPEEEKMPGTNDARMEEDKMIQEKPLLQKMDAPEEEEAVQTQAEEEEEPVQMKAEEEEAVQAQAEEEEPVQMQEEEEPVQMQEKEEEPVQMQAEEEEPVQMQAAEEEEEMMQTKPEGAAATQASPHLGSRIESSRGKGKPLPKQTRSEMETAFGVDFGGVNIHTGQDSAEMNRELGAQAFTNGKDVYFNSGKFRPESTEGKRLLAHELTHVVQQGATNGEIKAKPNAISPSNRNIQKDDDRPAGDSSGGGGGTGGGTAGGQVCPVSGDCPSEFCTPFSSREAALAARFASRDILLAGISRAVNPRVVPLWRRYIDGGTAPMNLSSVFGADFTLSATTTTTTDFLMRSLVAHLQANPPTFPAGVNTVVLDIATLIPTAIAQIDNPASSNVMDFNVIGEVPGNIAGGVGKDQLSCPAGAMPSPFNDSRTAGGQVIVTRNPDASLTITAMFNYQVKDTIDLCPGNCGATIEQFATIPLSKLEASGVSGDVPFEVNFPAIPRSETTSPGVAPPTPVTPASGVTTASSLRIRQSPSTAAAIVGNYPRGTVIGIVCQTTGTSVEGNDTWYQTDRGFVSGNYVTVGGSSSVSSCSSTP